MYCRAEGIEIISCSKVIFRSVGNLGAERLGGRDLVLRGRGRQAVLPVRPLKGCQLARK